MSGKISKKVNSKQKLGNGSGCGSVGRAVTSDSRGPRFESSHRQKLYFLFEKIVNKQNEAELAHF